MRKIVMVEDNADHALLIRKGIEGPDCEITHFQDGFEAVQQFEKMTAESRPDLVLLDINLPGVDGFGVLKQIQKMEWGSEVPVVMLTTSNRKEEITQAYHLGARGFVVKSDDFSELVNKLKRVKEYWFHTVELPSAMVTATERKK